MHVKKVVLNVLKFLAVIVLTAIISSIVNSVIAKTDLWNSLLIVLKFPFVNLRANILILLGLIIFLFFHLRKRIDEATSDKKLEDIVKYNKNIKSNYDELKRINEDLRKDINKIIYNDASLFRETLEFKKSIEDKYGERINFILTGISDSNESEMSLREVKRAFFNKYNDNSNKDFYIIWNIIIREALVNKKYRDDYSIYQYFVTGKGCDYLIHDEIQSEKGE